MTPCEKLGYKVGDKFEVVESCNGFEVGDVITLSFDDGSQIPKWGGRKTGRSEGYLKLSRVKPLATPKLRPAKQALADAIHASGKGWPDGANWACQPKHAGGVIMFADSSEKPKRSNISKDSMVAPGGAWLDDNVAGNKLPPNWHQTVLSRDEYFSAYPETAEPVADADGWIEWSGGTKPLSGGMLVDVKFRDGMTMHGAPVGVTGDDFPRNLTHWGHNGRDSDIVAYRAHMPGQRREHATRSVTDPDMSTADTLLTTWQSAQAATREARAALEAAEQAEREAEEAVKAALGKYGWGESIVESVPEKLVVKDWRDLRVGDEIKVTGFECEGTEITRQNELLSAESCVVIRASPPEIEVNGKHQGKTCGWALNGVVKADWKFIRRP